MRAALLAFLFASQAAFGAISATAVWEFRASATAANANGGCYDGTVTSPGTDWTKQDPAQYTATGTLTTAGISNVILYAAAAADMNGNCLHITGGTNFTPGWYLISTVNAGVSVTVDRNATTAAGAGGNGTIGGAMSLNSSTANQTDSSLLASAVVAGNILYFKNGAFTLAVAVTPAAGSITAPIKFIGYNSSRTDNPTGSNRPTITQAAVTLTPNSFNQFFNMIFTGTNTSVINASTSVHMSNCKVTNTSTLASRAAIITGSLMNLQGVEAISYRGTAVQVGSNINFINGCYFHDSNIGITMSTGGLTLNNSIVSDNVANAVSVTGSGAYGVFIGNTFYGAENKLGVGIGTFNTFGQLALYNNIIYGFTTGISLTANYPSALIDYNDINNFTTAVTNGTEASHDIATAPGFGNVRQVTGTAGVVSSSTVTDTGASFANVTDNVDFIYIISGTGATAGKYLINSHTATSVTLSSAPGGSGTNIVYQVTTGHNFAVSPTMKFKGYPGAFTGSSTTGYLDIGGVQRHEYGRPVQR